ncbi:MAG TPA: response regulator [Thermoanaerobaculia bacterium]|nr:response regulator [Thermoanaerobaculia bacterium]
MNKILLVEDSADDVDLTLRAFRKTDSELEVIVARDGVEALDKLAAADDHTLPALVLLDLKMPKMGGLDVLREIRKRPETRHLPVVMLSSSVQEEDVEASYASGANAYLRKPLDYRAFLSATRSISEFWIRLNERPA